METLRKLTDELSKMSPDGSKALIQSKMENISNTFNAFKDTVQEKYVIVEKFLARVVCI